MKFAPALFAVILTGCGRGDGGAVAGAGSKTTSPPPKITQFYARNPSISTGEPALICYGVENAKAVWIEPAGGGPRQELSAALTRCVEMHPAANTTYTLTAEGEGGKRVTQDVAIGVGPPKVKIANVNVSAVDVKAGETVTVCYTVDNARSVTITPPGFRGGVNPKGCATHQPARTTEYVVAATGPGGDRDEERVTVRVH